MHLTSTRHTDGQIIPSLQFTMANAAISTSNTFNTNQAVRVAQSTVLRGLEGTRIDRLVKKNNLVLLDRDGNIRLDADGKEKVYAGLVPVIGGTERLDLAILTFDLLQAGVLDYTDPNKAVNIKLADKLHTTAATAPRTNYDVFLDTIAAAFASGGTIHNTEYVARNMKGGVYAAVVLGIN